ncbi:carbon-nitrogen hydrolase family protein [Amycolatopsis sp. FDAARGOS 1241]|uniref:carbon-nitrogen hydrolase family protein n=1 Tax=Amycolatopsis sp. FDAARGOS 1241 TaxID=2778070 RepID=UPI0019502F39|nr:carbon-nitrogen hydrolase family protein [Amycolatopsis sp. FDAARGOS 1241]QRP49079.1 carbon-nitrogen hydrolase family protein [Amycolatopsis sp. FDAARGOS 1241]
MGDQSKFKAAAVQAAPVFLDREASVAKACALIEEAGRHGARLIALPEVFIPGGPYWAWHLPMAEGRRFSAELFHHSVEIPSDTTMRLGEAARTAGAYVAIGINERSGKTLYNTLLYFDPAGRIIGKHRKFRPTGPEKLVWGDGDGSTHKVYDTEVGKLGGLICAEHTMALPGYTLAAMGEQVHIASWLGFSSSDVSLAEICSRYHAIAYNTFVVASQLVVGDDVLEKLGIGADRQPTLAWSAIIEGGTGRVLAGPLGPDEEGIVYGEIDLNSLIPAYFLMETTGHYWPKQFSVHFDDRELKPLTIGPPVDDGPAGNGPREVRFAPPAPLVGE